MLRPHTFKKSVTFTEEEWLSIYHAAKQQGVDPAQFIKAAAVAAGEKAKS